MFVGRPDRCPLCGEWLLGYGVGGKACVEDPRDFVPDGEVSGLDEVAAWEEACRRAAEGRPHLDLAWGGIGTYWAGRFHECRELVG